MPPPKTPPDPFPLENSVDERAIAAQVPRLRRYAATLAGNLSVAADLVQDCIEKALANRHALRDGARLGGWLLSILHNLHVSGFRGRRRRGPEVPAGTVMSRLARARERLRVLLDGGTEQAVRRIK